jgi:hypothetical protein
MDKAALGIPTLTTYPLYVIFFLVLGHAADFSKDLFFYRVQKLWNALPLEIRELNSLSLFKCRLESHLWDSVMNSANDGIDTF